MIAHTNAFVVEVDEARVAGDDGRTARARARDVLGVWHWCTRRARDVCGGRANQGACPILSRRASGPACCNTENSSHGMVEIGNPVIRGDVCYVQQYKPMPCKKAGDAATVSVRTRCNNIGLHEHPSEESSLKRKLPPFQLLRASH
jgi:hypothetical protein